MIENGNHTNHSNGRSARKKTKPKYLDDYETGSQFDDSEKMNNILHYCYFNSSVHIPQSYHEAMSSPEAHKWQNAMKNEMRALEENDTLDLVPQPDDQ